MLLFNYLTLSQTLSHSVKFFKCTLMLSAVFWYDHLISEIEKAIKDLKSGKASGSDMITSEMIKALDETGVKIIHKLVNDIYKTGVIPTSMNESIFIRLPKKPKATMCTEYRTLSLMSHVLKVILKVILLRNKQKIENEISNLQKWLYVRKRNPRGNLQHENVM